MGERNPPHLYKTYRWRKDRAVLLLLLLLSTLLSRVLLRREKKLCLYFYSPVVIKQPGAHHRHVTRSEDIRTGNISCINTTELFYRFVPFKKKKFLATTTYFVIVQSFGRDALHGARIVVCFFSFLTAASFLPCIVQ